MTRKNDRIRISVTLPRPYVEGLDLLVEEGIYLGRGEVVLEALRRLLGSYGVEPFTTREQPEGPR